MGTNGNTSESERQLHDGTPEQSLVRFGEEVAKDRTRHLWGRARLANEILRYLPSHDRLWKSCGESYIKRLETGRVVKITRVQLEAICSALECTPERRAELLLYADRNVVANGNELPSPAAHVYNVVIERRFRQMESILAALLEDRRRDKLSHEEMEEFVDDAWDLVRKGSKRMKSSD